MRRLLLSLGIVALLAGCAGDDDRPSEPPSRFMTRNLYLGAGLELTLQSLDPTAVPATVAALWAEVQASRPPERMARIAAEIAAAQPDLVALQEVAIFETIALPAGTRVVVYDFLELLLGELRARGLDYRAVSTQRNFDQPPLPLVEGSQLLQFTDRDVILARGDVLTSDPRNGTFATLFPVLTPLGAVEIPRGWASVRAERGGVALRFVNTHLEAISGSQVLDVFQEAQARELVDTVLVGEPLPTVLAGDFNSNANPGSLADTGSYEILVGAGFRDAWSALRPGDAGLTCCHDTDLLNPVAALETRIDLVLVRGALAPQSADVVGEEPADRTPTLPALWPSDHAGVVATLQAP